jgi:hypothetical protein
MALQKAIRRCTGQLRLAQSIKVQIQVGFNVGEVLRALGNDLRMGYSAIRKTTYLAPWMALLASHISIQLIGDTLGLIEGYIEVVSL